MELKINDYIMKTDVEVAKTLGKVFVNIPIITNKSLNLSPTVTESLFKENIGASHTNLKLYTNII